ncbi:unnamed protein product [Effrenium voratum]|uniref:Uncharacterized protein n=1 Tax=Effrenium voratum TaxID=2562239 RepID=A0AA36N7I2_9DINO|nr:unnamed protein product [Effrenium voratum]
MSARLFLSGALELLPLEAAPAKAFGLHRRQAFGAVAWPSWVTRDELRAAQGFHRNCEQKYAACDPKAERVKPKFMIYRSTDILRADPVRLPLLQMDLHLHVDFRNRRADFCTPNFAPIMLDTNWHWSTFNWLPFDLRRSVCFGARIHPPGVSVQVTRCSHSGFGTMKKQTHSVEWSFTGVAYLISHYNTWGTGDGDMTQSWFGGSQNWGQKAK